jgi:hypothetical protein
MSAAACLVGLDALENAATDGASASAGGEVTGFAVSGSLVVVVETSIDGIYIDISVGIYIEGLLDGIDIEGKPVGIEIDDIDDIDDDSPSIPGTVGMSLMPGTEGSPEKPEEMPPVTFPVAEPRVSNIPDPAEPTDENIPNICLVFWPIKGAPKSVASLP